MLPQRIAGRYRPHDVVARHRTVMTVAAHDERLGRDVELALPRRADGPSLANFTRTVDAAARAHHPHLLPLTDFGRDGSTYFAAFEPPETTLASVLTDRALSGGQVRALGLTIASALGALHAAGAHHGALHPGSVAVDAMGEPHLALSPLAPPPPGWGGETAWDATELLRGDPPTVKSDVWALGALLLNALVGPGPGSLDAGTTDLLASWLRPNNDAGLIGVVTASLAVDPAARPTSMDAVVGALSTDDGLVGAPTDAGSTMAAGGGPLRYRHRPAVRRAAAGAAVAVVLALGLALSGGRTPTAVRTPALHRIGICAPTGERSCVTPSQPEVGTPAGSSPSTTAARPAPLPASPPAAVPVRAVTAPSATTATSSVSSAAIAPPNPKPSTPPGAPGPRGSTHPASHLLHASALATRSPGAGGDPSAWFHRHAPRTGPGSAGNDLSTSADGTAGHTGARAEHHPPPARGARPDH